MKLCFTLIVVISVFTLSFFSCAEHHISGCDSPDEVSYINEVDPLVIENCAISGCHNGDNGADKNWTEFEKFQSKADEVKRRINLPEDDGDHMPRVGELTAQEIQTITCWVEQGAQEN